MARRILDAVSTVFAGHAKAYMKGHVMVAFLLFLALPLLRIRSIPAFSGTWFLVHCVSFAAGLSGLLFLARRGGSARLRLSAIDILAAGFYALYLVAAALSDNMELSFIELSGEIFMMALYVYFRVVMEGPSRGNFIEKLSFFTLVISLPIGIFTSLLAVPLAGLLFGSEYTRTADVLRILIWYTVVTMVANVFAQALLIENRQRRTLAIRSAGLAINIALNLLLLPRIGVPGAAVASLVAECIVLALLVRSFTFPPGWWANVIRRLVRLAAAGAVLAGIVLALRGAHPLLAAGAGAPAYVGLVLASGAIAKDDWDLIYRLAIAMPGGTMIGRYWQRQLG